MSKMEGQKRREEVSQVLREVHSSKHGSTAQVCLYHHQPLVVIQDPHAVGNQSRVPNSRIEN